MARGPAGFEELGMAGMVFFWLAWVPVLRSWAEGYGWATGNVFSGMAVAACRIEG